MAPARWLTLSVAASLLAFAQHSSFQVASVKPSRSNGAPIAGGPGTASPERVTLAGWTLKSLLRLAYGTGRDRLLREDQISGPTWLDSEHYDVIATMPPGTTNEQMHSMLQDLLGDRFQLQIHSENKQVNGYGLSVAAGGIKTAFSAAKLVGTTEPRAPAQSKEGTRGYPNLPFGVTSSAIGTDDDGRTTYITSRAQSMENVAHLMEQQTGQPVIDRTGLQGKYDFQFFYSTMSVPNGMSAKLFNLHRQIAGGQPANSVTDLGFAPSFFAAVENQLGLKLEKKTVSILLVVIEKANKVPRPN